MNNSLIFKIVVRIHSARALSSQLAPLIDHTVEYGGTTYHVTTLSNSTISNFTFDQPLRKISFNVTGILGTSGYCNVTILNELLEGPYTVLVDGSTVTPVVSHNATHTSLYFIYTHSRRKVEIIGTTVIPEFSTILSVAMLMITTTALILFIKKRSIDQN